MAGYSLYNHAYGQLFNSEKHITRGARSLERAFDALNGNYVNQRLYNETAELGLSIEIAKDCNFFHEDTNEILSDFDELLSGIMIEDLETGNFDPAIGALSFGYYFLKRAQSDPKAIRHITTMCEHLQRLSRKSKRGLYWNSKLMDDDSIYLGISHGLASIIVFHYEATKAGVRTDFSNLIRGASDYILSCELQNQPVIFPVVDGKDNGKNLFANNWCYGDPGTLYGLLLASQFLNDKSLYVYTIEKFKDVVRRQNGSTFLIAGYGLLYGYSGLAMLYKKCHDLTNESFFKEASDQYLSVIIKAFEPEDEFLGYKGYWNQEIAVTNYSFAEGLTGISLFLMSQIDPLYEKTYRPLYYL